MTEKKTEKKFKKGEVVWFYPLPTTRPRYRRQVRIADVLKDEHGEWYRTDDPRYNLLFPTFHSPTQFEKVKPK